MGQILDKPGIFPKQKPDEVVTWERSDLFAGTTWPRYNPDSLVGRKGLGIYETMRTDEQVKAVLTFKRDAVLGRGWQFCYDDDDDSLSPEEKQARIKLFTRIVDSMDHPFIDALRGVFSAMYFGFSVSEKVYSNIVVDGARKVGLRALLTRDPRSFYFETDGYGVLSAMKQRAGARDIDVDPDRVVHVAHNAEQDRYYGESELKAAYRSYYIKDVVAKLWSIYLERFAGGFLVAKEPTEQALSPSARTALEGLVRNARNLSGIVLPSGVELDALMPSNSDQYQRAIEFHDLAIAKALLVPNLLGVSHTGQTGAYSQSQTQLEAFMWHINAMSLSYAEILNKQLFRDLGDQNWGDEMYPEFRFKPGTMDDAKWLATTWAQFTGANIVVSTLDDEKYLRKLLGMPPREEETPGVADEVAQRAQERTIAQAQAMPKPEPPPGKFARADFGDLPGHEFHGNQWTDGAGGGSVEQPKGEHDLDRFINEVKQTREYKDVESKLAAAQAETKSGDVRMYTKELHTDEAGNYTAERAAIHEGIIESTLTKDTIAAPGEAPEAVILMGAPGVGKTTSSLEARAQLVGDKKMAIINADDVKGMLPEYKGWNAALVHEESSDIVEGQMIPRGVAGRHNMVLDITGNNAGKTDAIATALGKAGYKVHIVDVTAPTHVSVGRAWKRFGDKGRFVPPDYARAVNGHPDRTYARLKANPYVSGWRQVDNSGTRGVIVDSGGRT